jgi:hypothetical protein
MSGNKWNYEDRKRSSVSGSITPYLSDLKNNLKKGLRNLIILKFIISPVRMLVQE